MTLKQLKKIFNNEFRPPFTPKDLISCEWKDNKTKKILCIAIGPRDIEIDEEGRVLEAGTCI